MFAWGGPFITAIVWFSIHAAGKLETLTVTEAVIGIITTTVLAFIAAGISVIHQTENDPDRLEQAYQIGQAEAMRKMTEIRTFLQDSWKEKQ